MVTSSLCFKEAHEGRLSGEISLEESLSHVVAHYGTSRHETDQDGRRPYFPRGFETEVRDLVLSTSVPPLGKEGRASLSRYTMKTLQSWSDTILQA